MMGQWPTISTSYRMPISWSLRVKFRSDITHLVLISPECEGIAMSIRPFITSAFFGFSDSGSIPLFSRNLVTAFLSSSVSYIFISFLCGLRCLLIEYAVQGCQCQHVCFENLIAYVKSSSGGNDMRLNFQIVCNVF